MFSGSCLRGMGKPLLWTFDKICSSGSPEPSIVCAVTEEQVMCIAQVADRGFFHDRDDILNSC